MPIFTESESSPQLITLLHQAWEQFNKTLVKALWTFSAVGAKRSSSSSCSLLDGVWVHLIMTGISCSCSKVKVLFKFTKVDSRPKEDTQKLLSIWELQRRTMSNFSSSGWPAWARRTNPTWCQQFAARRPQSPRIKRCPTSPAAFREGQGTLVTSAEPAACAFRWIVRLHHYSPGPQTNLKSDLSLFYLLWDWTNKC